MVKLIAKLSPWLAPIPSAYFVARSSMAHLNVPLVLAIIIGVVLELLGIATVHTALSLYRWNIKPAVDKEKGGWERAPLKLSIATCAVYFVAVLFLSVVLETVPQLAPIAPTIFPVVAVVGAVTLAIVYQHDERVARYGRKDANTSGIKGVYNAWMVRTMQRINGNGAKAIPAPAKPKTQDAKPDAPVMHPVCQECGEVVASGNMGSHRRWHCTGNGANGKETEHAETHTAQAH
ncbi:MAG: hypothetical protein GWN93_06685 [Deltaproteobacteria bacterium]|nr:hypothetical protein [Deltaproteobacteria bacterium]